MSHYSFSLKELPYDYEALKPVFSSETLHFHHDKHLNAYVQNLNKALESCPDLHRLSLPEILANLDQVPENVRTAVRNNGGGVFNHELFFSILAPRFQSGMPSVELKCTIDRDFGGLEAMFAELKKAAVGRFGSGWAYVVADQEGKLSICSTPNQDVPDLKTVTPILTVDVWEHAYYLDYQNRRPDYFDALVSIVDWDEVSRNYAKRAFVN